MIGLKRFCLKKKILVLSLGVLSLRHFQSPRRPLKYGWPTIKIVKFILIF